MKYGENSELTKDEISPVPNVPLACSYQIRGDNAFHFNRWQSNVRGFGLAHGGYRSICKKGTLSDWLSKCSQSVDFSIVQSQRELQKHNVEEAAFGT